MILFHFSNAVVPHLAQLAIRSGKEKKDIKKYDRKRSKQKSLSLEIRAEKTDELLAKFFAS